MKAADYLIRLILAGAIIDIMIVLFMFLSVAQGQPVEHTQFWDAQMKFALEHGVSVIWAICALGVGWFLGEWF